jgi:hypothetical protein
LRTALLEFVDCPGLNGDALHLPRHWNFLQNPEWPFTARSGRHGHAMATRAKHVNTIRQSVDGVDVKYRSQILLDDGFEDLDPK